MPDDNRPDAVSQIAAETIRSDSPVNIGASAPDAGSALEVQVYRTFDELAPHREEWDAFIEATGCEIFLTFDWLETWWKYYGEKRKLLIVCIRNNGELVGALPLMHDRIKFLLFSIDVIKIVGTDYMPITVSLPIQLNNFDKIVQLGLEAIQKEWSSDIIYFGVISGKCAQAGSFYESLKSHLPISSRCIIHESGVQTYFQIEKTWQDYLSKLNKSKRYNLRHCLKDAADHGVSISSFFVDTEKFEYLFEKFYRQHQDHWRARGFPGHFEDWPSALQFHRDIAKLQLAHDRLRLMCIQFNGEVIGFEYMYKFGCTYYHFLGSRANIDELKGATFGRVSFHERFVNALKENVSVIDSMRGHYPYKIQLGGYELKTHRIFLYSGRTQNRAKIFLANRIFSVFNLVYLKIWRRRIAPRIKHIPGIPLDFWLRTHMLIDR